MQLIQRNFVLATGQKEAACFTSEERENRLKLGLLSENPCANLPALTKMSERKRPANAGP